MAFEESFQENKPIDMLYKILNWLRSKPLNDGNSAQLVKPARRPYPTTKKQKKRIPKKQKKESQPKISYSSPRYTVKNDGTSVDGFVAFAKDFFKIKPQVGTEVSGFSGLPKKGHHAAYDEIHKINPDLESKPSKTYWVRLAYAHELEVDPFGWLGKFEKEFWGSGLESDEIRRRLKVESDSIFDHIKNDLPRNVVKLGVAYSKGRTNYISFAVTLTIGAADLITHCWGRKSDVVKQNLDLAETLLQARINSVGPELTDAFFRTQKTQNETFRTLENEVRDELGIPKIGDGWISETLLYTEIANLYPSAIREFSPEWLGQQRFDIFIPELNLAIEYQGLQHYQPVSFFGGKQGFRKNQERDITKRQLASLHGVCVYDWKYSKTITSDSVRKVLADYETSRVIAPQSPSEG